MIMKATENDQNCDYRGRDGSTQTAWLWFSRTSVSGIAGNRIYKAEHSVFPRGALAGQSTTKDNCWQLVIALTLFALTL